MLNITSIGIIYQGKMYRMSKSDIAWVLSENKREPYLHPARNLKSVAHTVWTIVA